MPPGHPEPAERIKAVWQLLDDGFPHLPRHEAPFATAEQIGLVHGAGHYDFIAAHVPTDGTIRTIDGDTHMGAGSLEAGMSGADVVAIWRDALLPQIAELRSEIAGLRPELVIISAGFDAHMRDPLANIDMQTEDFGVLTGLIRRMAQEVAEGRIVSLLEGGYDIEGLRRSLTAHLRALG